ncbi:tryptophan--tRNA ligase [Candidatus Woesebacteria bacterium RIFOXYB1_FULL_38_16]|uniref:Tryptophan--tRNA ligase n=1 Tax=Candidatus Woesebacteria bacterium RIFOXYB1_FULL_38_16 TaxID=1802538 RepID=A0A1F8CS51_9BACT|nr:MAG: tryptophan--tRNA ligase [Candidatus Woesebacteria bacterium RIFOXYA1_FULL_38_9]OGM79120.1 MAG: tryptophan--tRNA ligase [Candidatus Woesebacteria bacterium RIFOXYB1_FULL_38_16]
MNQIKLRILSGITPSGSGLHIGNYFGAIKPQIELQNQGHEVYYFIADLHALTTVQDKSVLEENILSVVLDYLSLGLDPKKCVFFRQSDVPAHSQLAVILANYTSYGQMKRMHAFKDKLAVGATQESINMGLFNYPILMAADILLYKPSHIPVGEDQKQHVELARDIAQNMNRTYKKQIFPLPEPMISRATGKIIGTDGSRKMSKSLKNTIDIFEPQNVIKKQIQTCYTDPSRLKATDPGKVIGNPVFLYHDLLNANKEEVADLKKRYRLGKVGDVEVKEKLYLAHQNYFKEARVKKEELKNNLPIVKHILAQGANKAMSTADQTLKEVSEIIGIQNKLNF